jgi:hypothetical protein
MKDTKMKKTFSPSPQKLKDGWRTLKNDKDGE